MDRPRRLIAVGKEPRVAALLSSSLRYAGFELVAAESGNEAIALAQRHQPDLLVVDVELPDLDGFEVVRHLRRREVNCPALFLVDPTMRLTSPAGGLTVGGDDYLIKPFSLDDVVTRVETVLRRAKARHPNSTRRAAVLRFADLEFDEDSQEVRRAGRPVTLAPMERKLLRYLLRHAGMVVNRVQILEHVWPCGETPRSERALDVHISGLRRKIDRAGPPLIHTRYGVGYGLRLVTTNAQL